MRTYLRKHDFTTETVIISVVLLLLTITSVYVKFDTESRLYSNTAVVTELTNDNVICKDANGNIWSFSGIDDWMVGDLVSLTMDNNDTANIYDDLIVGTKYSGQVVDLIKNF